MTFHVLNGDSLGQTFHESDIEGEIIICREALIDGNLRGNGLQEFWQTRANHHEVRIEEYDRVVSSEFKKIINAPANSEFNLWFGYDLFCQVNMWFTLSIMFDSRYEKKVFVVYPTFLEPEKIWLEFGSARGEDLRASFKNRVQLDKRDLQLGKDLWEAYKSNDLVRLEALSRVHSKAFPLLQVACQAHIDRFASPGKKSRPETVVEEILKKGTSDFYAVFEQFYQREGVYGFGDTQFRRIYDKVMKNE
jgi:hypothetical protein